MKEIRHHTAHGGYVRIRWTPDGLEANTGAGWYSQPEAIHLMHECCPGELRGKPTCHAPVNPQTKE